MFADGYFGVKRNDDAKVHSKMGTFIKKPPFSYNSDAILSIWFYFE